MKKFLIKTLIFTLTLNPLMVGLAAAEGTADDYMKGEQSDFQDFCKQFPDKQTTDNMNNNTYSNMNIRQGAGSGAPAPSSVKSDLYNPGYYNQASQSNWVKAQVMQSLGTLANSLAQVAGTPQSPQAAEQAQQVGQALSQSQDPTFQQMGAQMTTESGQISNGNQPGALQTAQGISSITPPPVSANYTPTPQESALVQGLNTAIGFILQAFFAVLGASLMANILGLLGLKSNSNNITSAASANAGSIGTGIATGQPAASVVNNAGSNMLTTSGSTAAGAIQQTAPQVAPPQQSSNFNQTGSAPAGGN